MDKLNDSGERSLFNSPIETGVRSLVILNATYPSSHDINELVWFDHLVVHSADLGGPPSIHPKLPQRSGEILVRRELVQNGLNLMQKFGLISVVPSSSGICYQATEKAYPLVQLLSSEYSNTLKDRAKWLAVTVASLSKVDLRSVITSKIGNWAVEFQSDLLMESENNGL
ncbi:MULTISPECIES: ABC-three component system middle component 2 [unclassified Pseudomonas]|uniref:ABC-three component system middle component 2 n=1 Tax=unclassified Pseudomonas TaxID=196821 RepID=UPI0011A6C544|nr:MULTISPECIES: ABC-three component system middle component 2 [unclassified Pseudomonas]TWC20673.1 hypothetical protein FBY05_10959 [Pseudomonas sp. SJZ083]TWC47368.1 hypothetical protein FBY01_10959 [Pseudomonas sp. SJZ077]